jgi:hypothetical protein
VRLRGMGGARVRYRARNRLRRQVGRMALTAEGAAEKSGRALGRDRLSSSVSFGPPRCAAAGAALAISGGSKTQGPITANVRVSILASEHLFLPRLFVGGAFLRDLSDPPVRVRLSQRPERQPSSGMMLKSRVLGFTGQTAQTRRHPHRRAVRSHIATGVSGCRIGFCVHHRRRSGSGK